MISVKQAAQAAEMFAKDLYPQGELRHLRLEEAELSEDGSTWKITLGWVEPAVVNHGATLFTQPGRTEVLPRVYKVFAVDGESGEVKSLKIRDVAA